MATELSDVRTIAEIWSLVSNVTLFVAAFILAPVALGATTLGLRVRDRMRQARRILIAVCLTALALLVMVGLTWNAKASTVTNYLGEEPVALVTESDVHATEQGPVCDLLEVRLIDHVDDPAIVLETDGLDAHPDLYDTIVLDCDPMSAHFEGDTLHLRLESWSYLREDES